MILELLAKDIQPFWEQFKEGLRRALEEEYTEQKAVNILEALVSNDMKAFLAYRFREDATPHAYAFCVTCFQFDQFSASKNLMIYAMANFEEIQKEAWAADFQAIIAYAKAQGCKEIVAYSKHPYIINISKALGFQAKYTFLTFPL